MAAFKIQIGDGVPGLTLKNGHTVMIVEAEDATDALILALAHNQGPDEVAWTNATVTAVSAVAADLSPVVNPDDNRTLSYVFTITITGGTVSATFTVTAAAGDTYAEVMAAMVVLLNANPDIAGAAFASPLLTLADIADNIGDHAVVTTFTYGGSNIPSFLGAIVDEGIAGAVLTIATSVGVVAPSVELFGS